ncbi:hypothetical protein K438DRAFT_1967968 [Mycena galopus ATCC 62051]|nr:hypothetical protein K438DRAFT_1967968 [Mycena galopus ATCC 62051]
MQAFGRASAIFGAAVLLLPSRRRLVPPRSLAVWCDARDPTYCSFLTSPSTSAASDFDMLRRPIYKQTILSVGDSLHQQPIMGPRYMWTSPPSIHSCFLPPLLPSPPFIFLLLSTHNINLTLTLILLSQHIHGPLRTH